MKSLSEKSFSRETDRHCQESEQLLKQPRKSSALASSKPTLLLWFLT